MNHLWRFFMPTFPLPFENCIKKGGNSAVSSVLCHEPKGAWGNIQTGTDDKTTDNQHFTNYEKVDNYYGSFPHRKDQGLHGHVKFLSAAYIPVLKGKVASFPHALSAG